MVYRVSKKIVQKHQTITYCFIIKIFLNSESARAILHFDMLHHILNFGFLAKHSQSHALINLAALFKTTYRYMGVVFHVSCLQYLLSDTLTMWYSLKKLEHYGVRGIVLNYLPGRKQYVSVNGHNQSI